MAREQRVRLTGRLGALKVQRARLARISHHATPLAARLPS